MRRALSGRGEQDQSRANKKVDCINIDMRGYIGLRNLE